LSFPGKLALQLLDRSLLLGRRHAGFLATIITIRGSALSAAGRTSWPSILCCKFGRGQRQ
jgi:hypothetical protein